jgi:GT2 family glycosyltransferase
VNNDIDFQPRAYENLLEVARERPECGIVSMAELPEDLAKFHEATTLPFARFSAFLERRFVWDRLGGFDIRFRPAYWEDADYLRRIREANIPVALTIRAACSHVHFGSTPGLAGRVRRDLYYRRNRRQYVLKWGDEKR